MGRTFASLRIYNYRVWFFSALIANTGTWMQRVAQDWLVLAILTDDNAFAVGAVTALQFLPLMFFMPVAGILADRFDKRKILLITQLSQAIMAFALGAIVLSGHATVVHVCIFAFLLGTASAFDSPPRQVFVSELVPAADLPNAVGLNSTSFNLARLIGPGLSGLLIAWVGAGWVFIINGASFIATIFALLIMRGADFYPITKRATQSGKRGGIREGLAYVRGRQDLMVIFVVAGVIACLGMNFQLTTASMARSVFDKQAGEYGILGSVLAIGSLTGALLAARRRSQPRVRVVVIASLAFVVTASINAIMPTYLTYAISLIPVGLAMLTLLTSANTAVQMSTEPHMRGRVMALYQTVMQGSAPIGALVVGWISQSISPRWGIGIGPAAALIVTVGAFIWTRKHWDVEVRYHMRSRPHLEIIGPLEHEQLAREAEMHAVERTPGDQAR
ncbi:MFS transporter [Changpingibacter yushuensis]|uniref:MFS transporter n=1 Tax=Changpingibacter yushuensis TaxID=2758440 RepID=UPI0015F57C2A|nr:MFS transporter [Changpingibacter yushuensis]